MMKISVVTPKPTPYRDPFWNHLARRPEIDLHVFYCESRRGDRPWEVSWKMEYRAEIMPGFPVLTRCNSRFNPSIWRHLEKGSFDAILVGGYNHLTMQVAVLFARLHRIPYFVMSESHLAQPRAAWRKIVKYPLVRSIVRNAAGGFPAGILASEYLAHYGMDPALMSKVPNVPDLDDMQHGQPPIPAAFLCLPKEVSSCRLASFTSLHLESHFKGFGNPS